MPADDVISVDDLAEEDVDPVGVDEADAQLAVAGLQLHVHHAHVASSRPNAPVLLLLHGHSSSIHEFDDLYAHLAPHFEVFSFDQPNNGASCDVEVPAVIAAYDDDRWRGFEGLFFLRDTIDAFARAVVAPAANGRPVIVAGGSLGGNLGLFVAEAATTYDWLERVVVWSPGSAWKEGGDKPIGAGVARTRANANWTRDALLQIVYCQPTVPLPGSRPQPWFWWWDCWGEPQGPCVRKGGGACPRCQQQPKLDFPASGYPGMGARKVAAIEHAFAASKANLDGRAANRGFWHWEIAAEEVEFSHWKVYGGKPRYASIGCDVDFLAGMEDCHAPADLYDATRALCEATIAALQDTDLAVRGRWLEQTGHSIHNERPTALTKILMSEL